MPTLEAPEHRADTARASLSLLWLPHAVGQGVRWLRLSPPGVMGLLRRRLLAVSDCIGIPADLARDSAVDMGLLRGWVLNHHSSWGALCICMRERPESLGALLKLVGVTRQTAAFDACADAYSVYKDGCTRGRLQS